MRTLMSCLMLACSVPSAVAAKPAACDLKRVPFVYDTFDEAHRWTGSRDFEMLLDPRTCDVKHVRTPDLACELMVGTSHGSLGLSCGRSFTASWRVRDAGDDRSYFDTEGEGASAVVPRSADLKRAYAHLDDDDAAKPVHKDDFPREYTFFGQRTHVQNPDFKASVQSLKYRTMDGEERLAVSADAVVGCVKYQFGVILRRFEPSEADRLLDGAQKDMVSFLGDLRLEPVDDAVERLKNLKPVLVKEKVLEPITTCVRH